MSGGVAPVGAPSTARGRESCGSPSRSLDLDRLPHHLVGRGQVRGRSGYLAMQGQQVPG
jgi:hypothetical protein